MNEFDLTKLGHRIRAARNLKNKNQHEVAEAIGVSAGTISQWERGIKQPGILNLLNFCAYLNMSLDELLDLQKHEQTFLKFTFQNATVFF